MKDQFDGPQGHDANLAIGLRKPRILVAGEFSSGKTQLINGLIGASLLPSNVVATALPPVWLVGGSPAFCALDLKDKPLSVTQVSQVDVAETLYCIASHPAPLLRQMDIIDTPGNSDPNIPSESWQRMLDYADIVVWCTNATQAWRQSEKAVWENMPERLRGNAILLVTHADLIVETRNAERLMKRIARETKSFFDKVMLVSLLDEGDLATICAEVAAASDRLAALRGADNPMVSAFAADHAFGEPSALQVPEKRAIVPPDAYTGISERPVTSTEEVASTADSMTPLTLGRARRLWTEIAAGRDFSNPRVILAAVEALIVSIDLPGGEHESQLIPIDHPVSRQPGRQSQATSELTT